MPGAMPPDHARTLRERRPLSRRQRWLAGASAAVVVLAAVLVIVLTSTTNKPKRGCIDLTVPSITGAVAIDQCGAAARATCAAGGAPGIYNTRRGADDKLARACRQAGLPILGG